MAGELAARNEISESLVRRRLRDFFVIRVWCNLGDAYQANELRKHLFKKTVKAKRPA